jgi:hypothetical protein
VLAHVKIRNLSALAGIKMIDRLTKKSFAFHGLVPAWVRDGAKSVQAK